MRIQRTDLDALLAEAVDIPDPSARDAFLRNECVGDPEHLAQLQGMVRDYFAAEKLLDHPALFLDMLDHPGAPGPDHKIGPYKLREQLGEGGMGSVYVAEQTQPVRRKVALKIIKPGMDSRQVISRFETERQVLALMDHPNIARVLDAGTTSSGRPYFVMELVRGVPITEYCDSHQLGTRERLELFIQVCRAVQHAHQKGIIHRDLKPSNILVTLHDTTPVVKVIDFGVAKAIGQQLTDNTLYTGFSQMLGTPLYMSPEQACQSGLDIDTRSDIYSLGVLLYELLTGGTPFTSETLKQAGLDGMRRIIREEDPPLPSARVSTLQLEALSTISQQRKMDPQHLQRKLRGELDWIVMKAIEKDRNRRYESASSLAMEIRRYLNDEPVQAGPPSSTYRLGKFARRNKGVLLTLSLVGLAIVAGGLIAAWQAWEASQARNDALQKEQLAEANFQKALDAVDRMLTRLNDEKLKDIPQMETVRKEILDDALRFYEEFRDQRIQDPEILNRIGSTRRKLGFLQLQMNQFQEADESTRGALEIFIYLYKKYPKNKISAVELAETLDCMGWHTNIGNPEKMGGFHQQAIDVLKPVAESLPPEEEHGGRRLRTRLANSYFSLGSRFFDQQKKTEAENALLKAVSWCEGDPGDGVMIAGKARHILSLVYRNQGSLDKALRESGNSVEKLREALRNQPEDIFVLEALAAALHTHAQMVIKSGKWREAEQYYQGALDIRAKMERDYPTFLIYKEKLRFLIFEIEDHCQVTGQGKRKKELRELREKVDLNLLKTLERNVEDSPGDFQKHEKLFYHLLWAVGKNPDKCLRIALEMTENWPDNHGAWKCLGLCYACLLKIDEANQAFSRALELGPELDASVWATRGGCYLGLGRYEEARADFSRINYDNATRIEKQRLALANFHLGHFETTLSQISRAVEGHPPDFSALAWISPSLVAACPDKSFLHGIQRLIQLAREKGGSNQEPYLLGGQIFAELGDYAQAFRDYDAASRVAPLDRFNAHQQALLAMELGNSAFSRSQCKKMLEDYAEGDYLGESRWVLWTLALVPGALEDYSLPEKIARQEVEKNPQNKQALKNQGGILFRAGKLKEALEVLEKMEMPSSGEEIPGIHFLLAMVQQALGKTKLARENLAKARAEMNSLANISWMNRLALKSLEREAILVIGR